MKLDLATSRYQWFTPDMGVPVRTTVGRPRFVRYQYEAALALAPYELFRPPHDTAPMDAQELVYRRRLAEREQEILDQLHRIAGNHPGQRLVLLCYENVHVAGDKGVCHRRWFAAWAKERYGLDVPELPAEQPVTVQHQRRIEGPTLF